MKPVNGWENVQANVERRELPPGGYVVEILAAAVKTTPGGWEHLEISFDVVEGDFIAFFNEDYKTQAFEPKRWKGTLRQGVPKDDGSEQDAWTIRNLKTLTTAIEDSNEGYTWDWDETKLKGKIVGMLFRKEEYDYNGYQGMTTRAFKAIPADRVRKGDYKTPEPKMLKNGQSAPVAAEPELKPLKDDDVPF